MRWEHMIVTIPQDRHVQWESIRLTLDGYGDQGWELVSFVHRPLEDIQGGTGVGNVLLGAGAKVYASFGASAAIFKRPVAEVRKP
jgi:hypothetical protein